MFQQILKQFIRFAGVGAIGTAVHYTVLIITVESAVLTALPAATLGAVCGALVNYYLNYHYTFKSTQSHRDTLPKFLAIAAGGIALNGTVIWTLEQHAGLHYLAAQIIATGLVLLWGFSINRCWTFRAASVETD